ncbi:synaptonemal complex protein 1-like isoform X2 [Lithobates pipiens]
MCHLCLFVKVNGLHAQIEKDKMQHEETISSIQVEISNAIFKEETLRGEVQKLKFASDEAIKLQKETDVKCQHKITEMVALMEKHKHQYDKLIEEKDSELSQLRSKEQETVCSRALLEKELSSKNNEIIKFKQELQNEKEKKEKLEKEKIQLKTNMKHKEVQTFIAETPKRSSKIGSIQTSSSFSKRSTLAEIISQGQSDRKSDNKVSSPWTNSKSCNYTVPKGLYKNDGIFKSLHVASHDTPCPYSATPRKTPTESSIKPSIDLKVSTMKNMSQADWSAFPKVDRRRKMKAA